MNNSERMEPSNRWRRSSTRENSEFKWKHDHSVVGALEVALEPNIDLRAEMIQHNIVGYDDEFGKFLKVWEGLQGKKNSLQPLKAYLQRQLVSVRLRCKIKRSNTTSVF
mmetsp:Transcript_6630/g.7676  ORF Transcript_6630/g.7676 Transcript_6630/m.7676 type:complete len:109 (-) Transcript_6630:142-468(-)